MCWSLAFNKDAGWRYNIKIKLLIDLYFFILLPITKFKFFPQFLQCDLIHQQKVRQLFSFCQYYPDNGSYGNGLQKNLKIRQDKDLCSKWIFFFELKLEQGLFHFKIIDFLKRDRFHLQSDLDHQRKYVIWHQSRYVNPYVLLRHTPSHLTSLLHYGSTCKSQY